MKTKDLLKLLETSDPEAEVMVSTMLSPRVVGFHKAELLVGINAVENGFGKKTVFYPNKEVPDDGEVKTVCLVCEGV